MEGNETRGRIRCQSVCTVRVIYDGDRGDNAPRPREIASREERGIRFVDCTLHGWPAPKFLREMLHPGRWDHPWRFPPSGGSQRGRGIEIDVPKREQRCPRRPSRRGVLFNEAAFSSEKEARKFLRNLAA